MKILITGANGFIGSYLVDFFLRKNHQVIAATREFHGPATELSADFELISLNVLDAIQLNQFSINADIIIHTATANDIVSRNTLKGIELSAIGTKNILDLAVRNGIPKCIVFSTLQVYGTELLGNIDESSPLLYQNDYALNHLFAEMYAEMYSRQDKIQTVSVRPSNVYGRILTDNFDRWSLVPGCFCKEAHETGTITIKSSGKQLRNFINLENLSCAVECVIGHFPRSYECYNLGSSQTNTIAEVAEKVKLIYEKEYQKPLSLNITGIEPVVTNQFNISQNKLESIGFIEDENFNFESDIKQVFNYLKSK